MRRRLRLIWRAWFGRAVFEADLESELAFHLAERRDALVEAGGTPEDAARQARLELGMLESHKEACRGSRGLLALESLLGDLRYAGRGLRRSPGFTATALLVLGVSIGANALFFTVYRAYVSKGAPRGGGRACDVVARDRTGAERDSFSRAEANEIVAAGAGAFASAYLTAEVRLALRQSTQSAAYGRAVSASYFRGLGGRPRLGRSLIPEEDSVQAEVPGVVLSDSGWKRLLGADPAPLGRPLILSGTSFQVIGVLGPEAADFEALQPQLWISLAALESLRSRNLEDPPTYGVRGTLLPGISIEQASGVLGGLRFREAGADEQQSPVVVEHRGLLSAGDAPGIRLAAVPVFLAFALVLFVACANLANLSLARVAAREREIAIRLSLGAGRARVVRQLLVESLVLSILAALIALPFCAGAILPLQRLAMRPIEALGVDPTPISADGWTVVIALSLSVIAGLAFGLGPALQVTRRDLVVRAGGEGGRGRARLGPITLRRSLLVLQIALSLVLLVVASSLGRNASRSSLQQVGFDAGRILDAGSSRPSRELLRRLAATPGIAAVTTTSALPLAGNPGRQSVRVAGRSEALDFRAVDDQFFGTLEIPLLRGRSFVAAEAGSTARVAVVSAATARRLWPEGDALGQEIQVLAEASPTGPATAGHYEVVGISGDVMSDWFFQGTASSAVYVPAAFDERAPANVLVRAQGDSDRVLDSLRRVCAVAAPSAICEPAPLSRWLALQRAPFDVAGSVAAILGGAAGLISCVGLFGSVAFQVTRRRRELGVRGALGATPARLVGSVLMGAASAVLLGLALGLPLCAGLSVFLGAKLPGIVAFDGRSYGVVPLLLTTVALLAALLPALRAARIEPRTAIDEG